MSVYEIGPFRLDAERLSLTCAGEPVALGPKVVETLLALVEHAGEVVAKPALLDRIWPDAFVEEANLAQNVYVLRKAFRSRGIGGSIETVPRCGYRLTVPVRRLGHVPEPSPSRHGAASLPRLPRRIGAAIAGMAFVAAALVLVAGHESDRRGAAAIARSDAAARLYGIGRYYWNLRTRDGVQTSLTYFARAVDADPRGPRGYAGLADANLTMGDSCFGTHRPAVYVARARAYAQQAIALDPRSAEAHASLGVLALHRGDTAIATAELQRAIALDPAYGPAHQWYGIALLERGRSSEGVGQLKAAADLDPLSVTTTAWLASAAFASRRFDDAILYSRQALELSPQRADALLTIGEAYEARGDLTRAIAAFKRYGAVGPFYRPESAALLAHAYARASRMSEARSQLAYALAHASEVYPMHLAAAAAAVGDRDALRMPQHVRAHRMALENAARLGALRADVELRRLAPESA